jgi:MFS transporter, DHA3 family, macrolide efflux protein
MTDGPRAGAELDSCPSMRPFLIVWSGQAFSLLGSHLVQFALVWWLSASSNSATVLAYASLVALLPQIVIAPFAGALVDRWSRRRVLIGADGAIALATLLLALLFHLDVIRLWHVYALLFVRAAGAAFHWPAMQASTALMVPNKHLARVAGLNHTLLGLASILIPPLGALVIVVLPMQGILAIDVVTAVLAIVPLLFIAIPRPARAAEIGKRPSVPAELRAGLRYILAWRGLLLLTAMGVGINLLGRAAGSLGPILVMRDLGGGALELGAFQSAGGIGAVLGGVTLGIWGGSRRRMATALLALALDGLAIAVVGLSPVNAFPLVLAMILASGFLETMVFGLMGAVGQAVIAPEIQGRVFALHSSVANLAAPLGLMVAGPVADALGVQFWWLLTGVAITVIALAALSAPPVVQIEERPRPAVA